MKNISSKNKKVFVGMSGGVDSSLSAALLQKQDCEVVGVFIKTWSPDWLPRLSGGQACTWREERRDAMRAAAHLKIPLVTLDLEKEYKEEVADYMVREYRLGRIPNPDVMCNKVIKFGAFFDFAMKQGADYVATGHYARICKKLQPKVAFPALGTRGKVATKATFGFASLCAGVDKEKDQTYFLWTLTQKELSHTLFPIGHMKKSDVRKMAKKFGLPNAEKKDSQGLCFLGHIDIADFLKHYIKPKPGKVLNLDGEVIGDHEGSPYYTIGQRHGFSVKDKTPDDKPWYVVSKDIKKNTITVSHEKILTALSSKKILVAQTNWCLGTEPDLSKKYFARWRYRQPLQGVKIEKTGPKDSYKIIFDVPQESIASGQSVVFYDGDLCLGGGIIV